MLEPKKRGFTPYICEFSKKTLISFESETPTCHFVEARSKLFLRFYECIKQKQWFWDVFEGSAPSRRPLRRFTRAPRIRYGHAHKRKFSGKREREREASLKGPCMAN